MGQPSGTLTANYQNLFEMITIEILNITGYSCNFDEVMATYARKVEHNLDRFHLRYFLSWSVISLARRIQK